MTTSVEILHINSEGTEHEIADCLIGGKPVSQLNHGRQIEEQM